MEIYNEKMERMEKADTALGWLEESVRVLHHEAIEAIVEKWHYETEAQYPNGGRDVRRVIDVPGVEAREAWDEEIPIQIYHLFTAEELEEREKEATRPTMEQRMDRLENAMEKLDGALETAMKRWADTLEARGEG